MPISELGKNRRLQQIIRKLSMPEIRLKLFSRSLIFLAVGMLCLACSPQTQATIEARAATNAPANATIYAAAFSTFTTDFGTRAAPKTLPPNADQTALAKAQKLPGEFQTWRDEKKREFIISLNCQGWKVSEIAAIIDDYLIQTKQTSITVGQCVYSIDKLIGDASKGKNSNPGCTNIKPQPTIADLVAEMIQTGGQCPTPTRPASIQITPRPPTQPTAIRK